MKFIIFILLNLFVLSSCQTIGRHSFSSSGYGNYRLSDWNESFYANARLPSKDSITTVTDKENTFLRIILKNLDKGWSKSDRKQRHGAPYWERAELKQRMSFDKNNSYEIEFFVRFISGFEGNRETFFQIHQYNNQCSYGPIGMLKFSESYLQYDTRLRAYSEKMAWFKSNLKINKLLNKWVNFKIIADMKNKVVNIYVDKKLIFKNINFQYPSCSTPHIKFGIYRPGNKQLPLKTSIVDFNKLQIKETK